MRRLQLLPVLAVSGCLHRGGAAATVPCSGSDSARVAPSSRPPRVLDGPGAWWQVPLPYTLIVDGSAVAIVHSETDTATVAATLRRLDPATIKVIDILRGPQAQKEYPAAVGTVVRVSRCH